MVQGRNHRKVSLPCTCEISFVVFNSRIKWWMSFFYWFWKSGSWPVFATKMDVASDGTSLMCPWLILVFSISLEKLETIPNQERKWRKRWTKNIFSMAGGWAVINILCSFIQSLNKRECQSVSITCAPGVSYYIVVLVKVEVERENISLSNSIINW